MSIARILVVATAALFLAIPASAEMTVCEMTYILSGWSVFYKTYKAVTSSYENRRPTAEEIAEYGVSKMIKNMARHVK